MFSDRIFQAALLISAFIHGAILFQNANWSILPNSKKEKIEVSYVKNSPRPPENKPVAQREPPLPLKIPVKMLAEKDMPRPFLDKETVFRKNKDTFSERPVFTKPFLMDADVIAAKKKITLPAVDIDKVNNPSYLSYYQIVREKIKRCAYKNYTHTDVGEVYLSFIISRTGNLEEVRLVSEKSSDSLYLRDVALKSIKEASAFPQFPKELDYPKLSFNVIISFELE
jgi:TonB family protein